MEESVRGQETLDSDILSGADGECQAAGDPAADARQDAGGDFASEIDRVFRLPQKDWKQYSPLTLAWIGDTVFDLIVRTVLVKQANRPAEKLHREASKIVNARSQAQMAETIRSCLSEEEEGIFRRGCNAHPRHIAKNADREQYLEATGLEALLGWLYLNGSYGRILELVGKAEIG